MCPPSTRSSPASRRPSPGVLCLEAHPLRHARGRGRGPRAGAAVAGRCRAGRRSRGSSAASPGPPADLEPAAPVRFAQALAAVLPRRRRSCSWPSAPDLAGWILVGPGGRDRPRSRRSRGICVGCEVYRLLLARRGGGDGDVRERPRARPATAPGWWCSRRPAARRCEPVARELERAAGDREVRAGEPAPSIRGRRRCPCAACRRPSRWRGDGRLRAARAGASSAPSSTEVLAAL